jgi:nitronate monooxygenase
MQGSAARDRAARFCQRYQLTIPILEAPMAGVNSLARAVAIANAGGMGAFGAAQTQPDDIPRWAADFRAESTGPLQINLWIPDPPPDRNAAIEEAMRIFLAQWGPVVRAEAGDATPPDFAAQCRAVLAAKPAVVSSIMGLFPASTVREFKDAGIAWFATATTLAEARAAQSAGADAIIAQGFEAGGHRGAFESKNAERQLIGLLSFVPRLADHIDVPVIAAGGIADGRGIAAALTLGASAVQIGTALLPVSESSTPSSWAEALAATEPEDTWPTRAFSGRLGRSLATKFVRSAAAPDAPRAAPHPVQRGLTVQMRTEGIKANDLDRIQAWAGQSAWMARREPAGGFVKRVWEEAQALLP